MDEEGRKSSKGAHIKRSSSHTTNSFEPTSGNNIQQPICRQHPRRGAKNESGRQLIFNLMMSHPSLGEEKPKPYDNDNVLGPDVQPPRPNDNTYWVLPGQLIAGEFPTDRNGDEEESRRKLLGYLDLGIKFFVDLTQKGEKSNYETLLKDEAKANNLIQDVEYRRLPIQDFGIPTKGQMKTILDTIDSAIQQNKTVYVHCRGGIGRTGTAIGCFLARYGNTGQEALDETNRLFQTSGRSYESSYSPETRAQMDFVRDWNEKND